MAPKPIDVYKRQLLAVDGDAGEGLVEDIVGLAALDGGEGGDEHGVGHRGLGHELDAPLNVLGSDLVTVVPVGVVPEGEGQGLAVGAIQMCIRDRSCT